MVGLRRRSQSELHGDGFTDENLIRKKKKKKKQNKSCKALISRGIKQIIIDTTKCSIYSLTACNCLTCLQYNHI